MRREKEKNLLEDLEAAKALISISTSVPQTETASRATINVSAPEKDRSKASDQASEDDGVDDMPILQQALDLEESEDNAPNSQVIREGKEAVSKEALYTEEEGNSIRVALEPFSLFLKGTLDKLAWAAEELDLTMDQVMVSYLHER